ncbi:hypothetical protein FEFB_06020 [Fructobacillus sp. EFB-N1]|uniref:toprim domain-containing protein n=1 Tax=Fructobacillus sp. EFB-N1 TaxID=1658766 RepID=UPI00064DD165|nr:toprim domain-containing protein [Fructobacillus sp. EFB-N1]KMK53667.1 hypothetical protein FEFB_06020 [Fructobacillus sp. EFB-N1]
MTDNPNYVSVEEYLTYEGYKWGKPNKGGYRLLDGHDSLFVNFSRNNFVWFARDQKGGLLRLMDALENNTNKAEHIQKLKKIRDERTGDFHPSVDEDIEHVQYDFQSLKTSPISEQSKKYLEKKRGIHPILVNLLADGGFLTDHLKEFTRNGHTKTIHNLMYNWRDSSGKIVGSDTQATIPTKNRNDKHQGYWKGIIQGSPASYYGFNFRFGASEKKQPDRLVITEAPIDAISYWQMHFKEIHDKHEQVAFLSLSGVKDSVLNRYISDHYLNADKGEINLPKSIHFATDNDKVGRNFAKKYALMLSRLNSFDQVELKIDIPADLNCKDWNDQLRYSSTNETLSYNIDAIDQVPYASPKQEEAFLQDEPALPKEFENSPLKETIDQNQTQSTNITTNDEDLTGYQEVNENPQEVLESTAEEELATQDAEIKI